LKEVKNLSFKGPDKEKYLNYFLKALF